MDKLMKTIEMMQNKNKLVELFDAAMDKATSILECQKVTFFICSEELIKYYLS